MRSKSRQKAIEREAKAVRKLIEQGVPAVEPDSSAEYYVAFVHPTTEADLRAIMFPRPGQIIKVKDVSSAIVSLVRVPKK